VKVIRIIGALLFCCLASRASAAQSSAATGLLDFMLLAGILSTAEIQAATEKRPRK